MTNFRGSKVDPTEPFVSGELDAARVEARRRLDDSISKDPRLEPHRAAMHDKLDRTLFSPHFSARDIFGPTKEDHVPAARWTGRLTLRDRCVLVRRLTPGLMTELETLLALVEEKRLNDAETALALDILRDLHRELGLLIEALDDETQGEILARLATRNEALVAAIKAGAKISIVAPAMTLGISHILSLMTGVPVDSTLVGSVWGGVVAAPLVESVVKRSKGSPKGR